MANSLAAAIVGQKVQDSSGQSTQFDTTRPGPEFFDLVRTEKRHKLRELIKEWFPNGVPPYHVIINTQSIIDSLPFIRATIRMTSEDASEFQIFQNEWCLWDTGAMVSYMRGGRLCPGVKGGHNSPENGFVMGEIRYVYLSFETRKSLASLFASRSGLMGVLWFWKRPLPTRNICRMTPTLSY